MNGPAPRPEPAHVEREVLELRHRIDRLGGLVTIGDLAAHWGLARNTAAVKVKARSFPSPIAVLPDGQRLWVLAECDEWHRTPYRERRRRSPVRPFKQPEA